MISPTVYKGVRVSLSMTQSEIADALGVSLRYVQYVENGQKVPSRLYEYAFQWLSMTLGVNVFDTVEKTIVDDN